MARTASLLPSDSYRSPKEEATNAQPTLCDDNYCFDSFQKRGMQSLLPSDSYRSPKEEATQAQPLLFGEKDPYDSAKIIQDK